MCGCPLRLTKTWRCLPASQAAFALSQQAAIFAASPGFDELLSLPLLHDVELFPHQLKTAKTVLRRFRGRALLCDEVGLGKTIEAGMILLELLMRKLVRRVLILTPSSLVEQWRVEMSRKIGLDFIAQVRLLNVFNVIQPKLSLRIRLLPQKGAPGETGIVFDPVTQKPEPWPCPTCGWPTMSLSVTPAGDVLCTDCACAVVPGRKR